MSLSTRYSAITERLRAVGYRADFVLTRSDPLPLREGDLFRVRAVPRVPDGDLAAAITVAEALVGVLEAEAAVARAPE